jgi:hypothetical protein
MVRPYRVAFGQIGRLQSLFAAASSGDPPLTDPETHIANGFPAEAFL